MRNIAHNHLANLAEHGLNPQGKMYIFLDGIQAKPEVMRSIKHLYDHYKIKFFLIGSSSFYAKNLFPESLSGKKFVFELFPLEFEEFLNFKDKKVYFCDHGIVNHFARVDEERLFENCVFNNLRKFEKINYYQKRTGAEIDFVLNEKIGVEAKIRGIDNNLRKLNKTCKKIDLKEFYVISNEYVEKEKFIPATNI